MKNLSEVLNEAADVIERRGWCQGGDEFVDDPWGIEGGPCCLEGGLMAVTGTTTISLTLHPAYEFLKEYLGLTLMPLFRWNDETSRTKEQVIETLRGAALAAAANEEVLEKVTA